MTATIEAPAVVTVTTLDGESRTAVPCPDGSWQCPFCSGANFPEGHEHYRRPSWDGPCFNPMCIVGGARTEQGTARYRETERRRLEREERDARWKREQDARKLAGQLAAEAAEAKRARLEDARGAARQTALQLSFGWLCYKGECEMSGWSREDYDAHMRQVHGLKAPQPASKPIRLRKTAPKASLPKLDFSPFKRAAWTQSHTEPATCKRCDHPQSAHHVFHGTAPDGGSMSGSACERCDCRGSIYGYTPGETVTAERRGQFWALGPDAHSAWFLPLEAAPWETGRPAPVLLYLGAAGRWHADAWTARDERKRSA